MCVSRFSCHIISLVVHKQCPVKVTEVFHLYLSSELVVNNHIDKICEVFYFKV